MKKQLLILVFSLFVFSAYAQLTVVNSGSGTVTVTYGATNDYSLFDPGFGNPVYLYLWVQTSQTTPNLAFEYNDDWNNSASLVILNYDMGVGAYVGVIDFNTHAFMADGGAIIPSGTVVNDFNLILKNDGGQSADLLASAYGYTSSSLANPVFEMESQSYFSNGSFYLNAVESTENINFQAINLMGQVVYQKSLSGDSSYIINLNDLDNKGYLLLKVTTGSNTFFVKKVIL